MLIGLSGRKRSGKDSAASVLIENHGFTRIAFADPLKAAALSLDPVVDWEVGLISEVITYRLSQYVDAFGWEKAKELPEVRRTLQHLGVAMREIEPDFWVDTAMESVDPAGNTVITDVRFPNEAKAIRAAGGVIVRINRPGLDVEDTHVSEIAMDYFRFDYWIENDGDLDQLHRRTAAVVSAMTRKATA